MPFGGDLLRSGRVVLGAFLLLGLLALGVPSIHSSLATQSYQDERVYSAESIHHALLPSGWSGIGFPVKRGDSVLLRFQAEDGAFDVVFRFGQSLASDDGSEYPYQVMNVTNGRFRHIVSRDGVVEILWSPVQSLNSGETNQEVTVAFTYSVRVVPNPTGLSIVPHLV